MVLNTTDGPRQYNPTRPGHVVNTSRVVEEEMQYEDEEPEIISVLPATGWHAVLGDTPVPLVAFVAMDSGEMYGVAVGDDGCIDLTNSVEKLGGFVRYEQANNDSKE